MNEPVSAVNCHMHRRFNAFIAGLNVQDSIAFRFTVNVHRDFGLNRTVVFMQLLRCAFLVYFRNIGTLHVVFSVVGNDQVKPCRLGIHLALGLFVRTLISMIDNDRRGDRAGYLRLIQNQGNHSSGIVVGIFTQINRDLSLTECTADPIGSRLADCDHRMRCRFLGRMFIRRAAFAIRCSLIRFIIDDVMGQRDRTGAGDRLSIYQNFLIAKYYGHGFFSGLDGGSGRC